MTTARTGKNAINPSDREGDDLTAIRGIGSARERWLRESFNVHTFQDLAALSADDIESRLKAEGRIVSRGEIEQWIARAQELAAIEPPSQQVAELEAPEPGERPISPAEEDEWKAFATFVVEFQAREVEGREERRTTVHYMEADRTEAWPGVQGEGLCQWMLDQVAQRVRPEREPVEEFPVEAPPPAALPATVEMAQVRAFQPPQAETPIGIGRAGQPFSGFVRGSEPLALEVSFGLTGPGATGVAESEVAYRAQFHVRKLATGERIHLGDTELDSLVECELSYTALLPEATLQPGMYRMEVLATLESTPPILGHLRVPLLQVA